MVSLGNFGRSPERLRPLVGDAEPILAVLGEQARPEPDGQGQLRGRQAEGLAGIRRWRIGIEADSTVPERLFAARHPLGHVQSTRAAGPTTSSRLSVVTSKVREMHPVLRLGDDAGLSLTAERHGRLQVDVQSIAGGGRPAGQRAGARGPDNGGAHPRRADQPSARESSARSGCRIDRSGRIRIWFGY